MTITFDLEPSASGHVLYVVGFLHSLDLRACHVARLEPLELEGGRTRRITLAFEPLGCPPHDIATMAVVVEGSVEVASRQEWSVRYQFRP